MGVVVSATPGDSGRAVRLLLGLPVRDRTGRPVGSVHAVLVDVVTERPVFVAVHLVENEGRRPVRIVRLTQATRTSTHLRVRSSVEHIREPRRRASASSGARGPATAGSSIPGPSRASRSYRLRYVDEHSVAAPRRTTTDAAGA